MKKHSQTMRIKYLPILYIFIFQPLIGQNYEQLILEAQNNIQKKDYCKALASYNLALKTPEGVSEKNPYTFYYAAISASHCNDNNQSILWLSEAQKKGLGNKPGEINHIEKDSAFEKLHELKEWNEIIGKMKESIIEKQAIEDKLNKEWNQSIQENALKLMDKKGLTTGSGYALFFTQVKDLKVPYLVFIPQKFDFQKPSKMIVYLHGGIVSTDRFNHDQYQLQQEPIFSIADTLNTIVVYPLGKKDFGWVNQQEAFDNIFTIINNVKKNFKIDEKNIFLGGMSNGGNATFYFATQKPNIFKGFFAISANPHAFPRKIEFKNLAQGKKFITLNCQDDSVYNFKEVEKVYLDNKGLAKDWTFRSLPEGEHGFIYNPENGKDLLGEVVKSLIE
ncbi:prolyl oligopeptidase family serine peptidase [Chryseobacterium sp. c4a]|uniref:prolyl oligopeptidase family serine peptidase n=1 Tax=Chryseobacterium sp. c4a TaxID=1573582 RepID=UPI00135A482B|nr:prolyl oligopeptidase family serine peptidase [Chryseobacterium sp. c4a]